MDESASAEAEFSQGLRWRRVVHIPRAESHTMNGRLFEYVLSKVPQVIRASTWQNVTVLGSYCRQPQSKPSGLEKRSKRFNWHRPTIIQEESNVLQLCCFPSEDYVRHYALLVATYLEMTANNGRVVQYRIPTEPECTRPFAQSNLEAMGQVDIVVVGYVEHLRRFQNDIWRGSNKPRERAVSPDPKEVDDRKELLVTSPRDEGMFQWQNFKTPRGRKVALLGCLPSFWGDASRHLVTALQRTNGAKCVIYVGKAGSLHPDYAPNECLATGHTSFLGQKEVTWDSALARHINASPCVVEGKHVTVFSPLVESISWLEEWQPKCRWVDCEIGHMAEASNHGGTSFGYLHIISDNVTKMFPHDLSNEELHSVKTKRLKLLAQAELILESFFAQWDGVGSNAIT